MSYSKTAAFGVSWISLLRVVTRAITFIRLAILGRLLTPTQFGYFGIASLLLALLEVITETGINVFLVQEKKDIKTYINAAWVISIFRGLFLAVLILVLAPFISQFFNAPGAYTAVALMAVVPFIRGFINPAIIVYQKDLLFKKEFRLRTILFFVDVIVSVVMAFITKNAVSFVYGLIASAFIEVILSFLLFPIKPKLSFERNKLFLIIKRGWWVTLTGVFSYIADNGDNLTVGKILGSSSLGIYQVAYKLSTLSISEITNVVNQVIFPVYTKFSEDKKRLKKAFIKVTLASSMIAFIIASVLFVFAEQIILIFMGNQWSAAIPAVKILAIYGLIRTIFGNFAPLFLAVQKQAYVAKMTFVRVAGLVISIIPLVYYYGMEGAAYAMLFSILVEIPVILYYAKQVLS